MPLGMVPSSEVSLLLSSVTGNPEVKRAMPASAQPEAIAWSGPGAIGSGNSIVEAGDEVVAQIEGRKSAAERGVHWIYRLGQAGGLIDGFRPGVAGQQFEAVGAMVECGFEGVVVGVGDGALQLDAAEGRTELGARGLLVERPAERGPRLRQRAGSAGLASSSTSRWCDEVPT